MVSIFLFYSGLSRISESVLAAAPGWKQVNQDGFVKNFTPDPTGAGTNLVAFDNQLYAATVNGLFHMEDPLTQVWTPWIPDNPPSGPGPAPLLNPLGNFLYAYSSGQIWFWAAGTNPRDVQTGWHAVTSIGLPGGVSPVPKALFNNRIYGVYTSPSGIFEIWRTADIGVASATWEQVAVNSLGNPTNHTGVDLMIVYSNRILLGIRSLGIGSFGDPHIYGTGVEIWESATGNSGNWSQVNVNGFGTLYSGCVSGVCNFPIQQMSGSAMTYRPVGASQEYLYIGTLSHFGAEIFRYDGSGVAGWTNVTQPWAGQCGLGCTGPGRNLSMAVYQGSLYVAEGFPKANLSRYDGNNWSIVEAGPNPFSASNIRLVDLEVFQGRLFVSTGASGGNPGDQVWGFPFYGRNATDRLSAQFIISNFTSPETERYAPAVAFNSNHSEYLVAWQNLWPGGLKDIYARRVSADTGSHIRWIIITEGSSNRIQPALAFNATNDEYLSVYMYDPGGTGLRYEVWGRIVNWDGMRMSNEFPIFQNTAFTYANPRVAWNSQTNEYLVAANIANGNLTFLYAAVGAVRVSSAGAVVSGSGVVISSTNSPSQVDIAYNAGVNEYLAVWRRNKSGSDFDIYAARLDGSSAAVISPPGEVPVGASVYDAGNPSVATNGAGYYLVAWQEAFPGACCDWDIHAQELDVAATPTATTEIILAASTDNEIRPRVAAKPGSGRNYMVTWQRSTAFGEAIYATHWGELGTPAHHQMEISAFTFWNSEEPAVAASMNNFLIAYTGDSADPAVHRHIYGRLWWAYGYYFPIIGK
jgi:hypothetical protein